MKIYLSVRDAGTDNRDTLYHVDLPNMEVWLPEGAVVSIPFGEDSDEQGGITEPVARCYFSIAKAEIHVELNEVCLDAPDSWGHRTVSIWRHDSFDGTVRTPEEFSRHVHEGLRQGGWKKHGR